MDPGDASPSNSLLPLFWGYVSSSTYHILPASFDDRVGVVYKKGLCMVISMGIGNDDMLSGFGYLGYALLNMHSLVKGKSITQ